MAKAGDVVYLVTTVDSKAVGVICTSAKSAFDASGEQLGEMKTGYRNYFNTLKKMDKATLIGVSGAVVRIGKKVLQ
jgi:hypothetical protein